MSGHTASSSASEIFGSNRMWGLKELPLPEPVSWMPQTVGWLFVAFLVACLVFLLGRKIRQRHARNAYRRQGLQALEEMASDPQKAIALPNLLRSAALHATDRVNVAALRGDDWISWLNTTGGAPVFQAEDARALDDLAYANPAGVPLDSSQTRRLIAAGESWMRSHRAAV